MSCYEGEWGSIVIPSAQWVKFKKAVRNAWNAWQDENYKQAMRMWTSISQDESDETAREKFDDIRHRAGEVSSRRSCHVDIVDWAAIRDHMLGRQCRNFYKPRKSWFNKATNRTRRISHSDWSITFINDKREVRWYVGWNNHAIERSRVHPTPCKMFYMLNHMAWTGKSGGTITSDNEYNRDAYGTPTEERYGKSAQRAYLMHR